MRDRRFLWVTTFALAMAYVEASVVVYLRRVLGVADLLRDVPLYDPAITAIEIGREAATLVMLLAAGCATGRTPAARIGFALYAFGLWDILYYVWLRALIGWPASLLTADVLFLIPLPWWGPVVAPVLIAILCVLFGAVLVVRGEAGTLARAGGVAWAVLAGGVALLLHAFMADAIRRWPAAAEELARLKPGPFNWPEYLAGLLVMGAALASLTRSPRRQGR